jgi:hypothetical protein
MIGGHPCSSNDARIICWFSASIRSLLTTTLPNQRFRCSVSHRGDAANDRKSQGLAVEARICEIRRSNAAPALLNTNVRSLALGGCGLSPFRCCDGIAACPGWPADAISLDWTRSSSSLAVSPAAASAWSVMTLMRAVPSFAHWNALLMASSSCNRRRSKFRSVPALSAGSRTRLRSSILQAIPPCFTRVGTRPSSPLPPLLLTSRCELGSCNCRPALRVDFRLAIARPFRGTLWMHSWVTSSFQSRFAKKSGHEFRDLL